MDLLQGIEDLSIEPFIPELAIEACVVTVFPRTARFNNLRSETISPVPSLNVYHRSGGPEIPTSYRVLNVN